MPHSHSSRLWGCIMKNVLTNRISAALALFGLLAVMQLFVPSAANAAEYGAPVPTQTVISGQGRVATVTVSADAGTPTGTVTLTVAGRTYTLTLKGGKASQQLPVNLERGNYVVTARYPGNDNGQVEYLPSSDTETYYVRPYGQVLGVEAYRALQAAHGANRSGVSGVDTVNDAQVGGLAATGTSTQTELLGLLGLGLVAAGGASIAVARRRSKV